MYLHGLFNNYVDMILPFLTTNPLSMDSLYPIKGTLKRSSICTFFLDMLLICHLFLTKCQKKYKHKLDIPLCIEGSLSTYYIYYWCSIYIQRTWSLTEFSLHCVLRRSHENMGWTKWHRLWKIPTAQPTKKPTISHRHLQWIIRHSENSSASGNIYQQFNSQFW